MAWHKSKNILPLIFSSNVRIIFWTFAGASLFWTPNIKPRANRRNNVGQHFSTLLDVTCCVRLHTLLRVVTRCWDRSRCAKFETGQTFKPTTPNISFIPWSSKRNNVGSVCVALPTLRIIHGLLGVYKVLWVVCCPRCTAGPNIVGSYRILLQTTANPDAAIPNTVGNIVGPSLLVSLNVKFIGHIKKAYSGTIKQLRSP